MRHVPLAFSKFFTKAWLLKWMRGPICKKHFLSSYPIHNRRKALLSYFFFILSPIEWEKPFFLTSVTLKQLGNTLSASKYRKCIFLFYFYPQNHQSYIAFSFMSFKHFIPRVKIYQSYLRRCILISKYFTCTLLVAFCPLNRKVVSYLLLFNL